MRMSSLNDVVALEVFQSSRALKPVGSFFFLPGVAWEITRCVGGGVGCKDGHCNNSGATAAGSAWMNTHHFAVRFFSSNRRHGKKQKKNL